MSEPTRNGAAPPRPDVPLTLRGLADEGYPLDYDIAVSLDGKLYHVRIARVIRDSEFPFSMGTVVLKPRGRQ